MELGFARTAQAGEGESENWLLEGEETGVSASYDPDGGTLVIRIARRPAEPADKTAVGPLCLAVPF